MAPQKRWFYLGALSVAYVALAALRAADAGPTGFIGFAAIFGAFGWGFTRSFSDPEGRRIVSGSTTNAMRLAVWAACASASAKLGPDEHVGFAAIAHAGLIIAVAAALHAVTSLGRPFGLLNAPVPRKRVGSPALALLIGSIGIVALLSTHSFGEHDPWLTRRVARDLTTTSGLASLVLLLVMTGAARFQRRLELGNVERTRAAFAACLSCALVGTAVVTVTLASVEVVMWPVIVSAAIATCTACVAKDPIALARAARIATPVIGIGTPTVLVLFTASQALPEHAPDLLLSAAILSFALGLAAPALSRPLAPEQGHLLDVVAAVHGALARALPEEMLASTLGRLRALAGPAAPPVELLRLHPLSITTVDLADYTHEAQVALPPTLVELALAEPEQILRLDVLEALEVRKPHVRPIAEWLRARGMFALVLLTDAEGPTGALLFPAGARTAPLMLEEARALRGLADAMSALSIAASAISRSQNREATAAEAAQNAVGDLEREKLGTRRALLRREAVVLRLARGAKSAAYGQAARLCIERLESLAREESPLAFLTPIGTDPRPYAAVAHLASRREDCSLLIVDATDPFDQRVETWADPLTSPLVLAEGGTLLVLDACALAPDTQTLLGELLRERRPPGGTAGTLDMRLFVSVAATVDTLVASGRMVPALADLLGDRAVPIPHLAARVDDLRAIVLERLARSSTRWRGRPLGIDPAALAKLADHAWPGNELELDDLLTRATATAVGDVLTVADLERLGFVPLAAPVRRPTSRPASPRERQ